MALDNVCTSFITSPSPFLLLPRIIDDQLCLKGILVMEIFTAKGSTINWLKRILADSDLESLSCDSCLEEWKSDVSVRAQDEARDIVT